MNDDPERFPPILIIEQDHTEWVDDDHPIDPGYKHWEKTCIMSIIALLIAGICLIIAAPFVLRWIWGLP